MSKTDERTVPCPTCKKEAIYSASNPYRPFCSERCRVIDLGAWASESYRIPISSSAETADATSRGNPSNSGGTDDESI